MDKKTIGLIATLGTLFVCGCPSTFLCIFGIVGISGVPMTTAVNGVESVKPMNTTLAFALLCVALIGLLVPVVVGFLTLRKKPEDVAVNAAPMPSPIVENDPFTNDAIESAPFANDAVENDPFANDAVENAPFDNAPPPTLPKDENSPFDADSPIPPPS